MKHYYTIIITILSVITSVTHAKEEPLRKLEDIFRITASPKDWHIESVSVVKINDPIEALPFLPDYRVTIKIRNISQRSIKISTNGAFSSFISEGQLSKKEMLEHFRYASEMMNQCCHPPMYSVVEPNQTYIGICRNFSKYEGKKMTLSTPGMTIGDYILKLGEYTAKPMKAENKSQ